jgi:hypothetical protein
LYDYSLHFLARSGERAERAAHPKQTSGLNRSREKEVTLVNLVHKSSLLATISIALLASVSPASADPFVASSCHEGDPLCVAEESALARTPFGAQENASALPELARGKTVKRSIADGSFTSKDKNSLRALGAVSMHAGVILMHKIPRRNEAQQKELRRLVHSVDAFLPSGACDAIVKEGPGIGLCAGTADGPVGKVAVRMPVSARLDDAADGSLHLVISNPRPMEIKPLLSWSPIVQPDHLKMQVDLFPVQDGWLVYSRIAVDMQDHVGSAKEIADAMEKLDRWLVRDLSR